MHAFTFGLFCAVIFTLSASQDVTTVHTHHSTREPPERDSLAFYYDANSNYMIMRQGGYCYFMALNTAEQHMVHNPSGLRTIETQIMHLSTSATHSAMKGGDHAHVSHYVYTKICAHEHMIKLVQ